ncbi:MAG: lactam utilization protein LamB, partial [Gammaproteobacteria bacterium]|nr:lactam utilization protein LamB [Gammaproteobacteria bacterium]
MSIDINCDLGEGSNKADCEKDALLMPYISSCNIACAAHAGNPVTIRESLKNAQAYDLKVGAHP